MTMFNRRQMLGGAIASAACASALPAAPPVRKTRFGINCFDLFLRPFRAPADPRNDPRRRLEPLAKAGLSFVRFPGGGFWPNDWKKSLPDHEASIRTMDRIFDAADAFGIGCIPSLFWYVPGLSDAIGLPLGSWNDPASPTWAAADRYIDLMVPRYANRSITMWEFGNEFDLSANWPGSERYFPKVNPSRGTLAHRSVQDRYTAEDVSRAYERFARRVRRYDRQHPIDGGSSIPRPTLIRDRKGLKTLDDASAYEQALGLFLPGDIDVLSVHIYPSSLRRIRKGGASYAELLGIARKVADRHGAKLFVGEFGMAEGTTSDDRKELDKQIQAIVDAGADYAALWVYDFDMDRRRWSVDPGGPRAWQFDALAAANR